MGGAGGAALWRVRAIKNSSGRCCKTAVPARLRIVRGDALGLGRAVQSAAEFEILRTGFCGVIALLSFIQAGRRQIRDAQLAGQNN